MRIRGAPAAALLAVLIAACGGDDEDEGSGNYRAASSPAEEEEVASAAASSDSPEKVVDPLHFRDLLPHLPAAASGWTADEPNGSTTAMAESKVTVVSNQFRNAATDGSPEQSVSVEITDGGFAAAISAPFEMMTLMSNETTDGYQKGVTVEGGYPGYETWDNKSRRAELTVLVAKRFLVHLTGYQVEPQALREWLGRMKLAELAEKV
jgi:hypothetical protein